MKRTGRGEPRSTPSDDAKNVERMFWKALDEQRARARPRNRRRRRVTRKGVSRGKDGWTFRPYDEHGKRRTVLIGTFAEIPTIDAAVRRANELQEKLRPDAKAASPLWTQYVAHYLEHSLPKQRPETQHTTRSVLTRHALARFKLCRVHQVAAELQAWVDEMQQSGRPLNVVRHRVAVVKAVLAAARADKLDVGRLPRLSFEHSNRTRRTHAEITFTATEEQRILAAARGAERAGYLLGLSLGLRPAEIAGVAWARVDLDARELTVAAQAQRGEMVAPKTERSIATLAIPDVLLERLRALRAAAPGDIFVLAGVDDPAKPMRRALFSRRLAALCQSLGIPSKGAHALRRRYADGLLEAGTPLHVIQQALRHADMATTVKYLSAAQRPAVAAAIRAAAERFHAGERDAVVISIAGRRRSRGREHSGRDLPNDT